MPLLVNESHVDERDLNVIGESPIKLGGRERLYSQNIKITGRWRGFINKFTKEV